MSNKVVKNKTLGVIIVFTIVVSLLNQMYVLDLLDSFGLSKLSGRAIDIGTASINISEDISITLDNNDTIDWGTGYVNTSNPACSSNATLTTGDNAAPGVATDSAGNDCWTGIDTNEDFVVRSLANVPITVTINASKNATEFLGPVAEFQYQTYNHTNGCAAGTSVSYVNAWQDFNETEQEICGAGENMTNAGNRVGITVRILVPVSITGAKNVSVTFTSQKA